MAISSRRRPRPPTALVFDFDGTILDTETPVFESWRDTFVAEGVGELSRDEWRAGIGHTSQRVHPLDQLEQRAGSRVDRDRVLGERLQRRDEVLHRLEPRDGVMTWMAAADALGLPMAIASSSPLEWVEENLERLGLATRFAYLSCAGGDVPGKPAPTVYEIACDRLEVEPSTALAIEDSPVGTHAARAAGLWVIAVPGPMTEGLDFAHADVVAASLGHLDPSEWLRDDSTRHSEVDSW